MLLIMCAMYYDDDPSRQENFPDMLCKSVVTPGRSAHFAGSGLAFGQVMYSSSLAPNNTCTTIERPTLETANQAIEQSFA